MKVKELINTAIITKINILVIPALLIVFVILGYCIYSAKYSFVEQSGKLKARITTQKIVSELEHIFSKYAEVSRHYNAMVSNYSHININDRREEIIFLTKKTLGDIENIDALCTDFQNDKFDYQNYLFKNSGIYSNDGHFCVYAERTENNSIILKHTVDDADKLEKIFPNNNIPTQMDLVGPYEWVNYEDTATDMITFWLPVYDSSAEIIGSTFLDIDCDNYYNVISDAVKGYDCKIFVFRSHSDIFLYHYDRNKIGNRAIIDEEYSESTDYILNKNRECTFDAYNNITKDNNALFFMPMTISLSNINLSIVVAFGYNTITQSMNTFMLYLILLLTIAYLISVTLIFLLGRYTQTNYSNAEITINNITGNSKYDI